MNFGCVMAEKSGTNAQILRSGAHALRSGIVHPAWTRLIEYCAELEHGEIEKLKIQDGVPMTAEVTMKKIKFSP